MEKIQQAIAKARLNRDAGGMPAAQVQTRAKTEAPSQEAATPVGPSEQAQTAWAKLKRFEPEANSLRKSRIMTLNGGAEARAFDSIRTRALHALRDNSWRRMAITSPSPACGKSTLALNLAFSLSRQSDIRTILIELDMQRPSLGKNLGISPNGGAADVLQGKLDFADQAICYNGNLAISLCNGPTRDTAELLRSERTSDNLAAIQARYEPDVMLFDMPPMLVRDDMMAFASQVDCALLLAAAEATTIKEIDECERELAGQTKVLGIVLNKCRYMGAEYDYAY